MKKILYKWKYLIWTLTLVLLTILSLFLDIPAAKSGDIKGFITYLDKAIPQYMSKFNIGGVAVGVVENGKVVYLQGYGYSDSEKMVPITENTVFQAASISKSVTAWGVMNLVEQGKLELDVPIIKYLKRWKLPVSEFNADGVTLRRLLSHTAGINNVGGGYAGFLSEETLQTLEDSLVSAKDANEEGIRIVYQPGTQHSYSGGGYTILQLLIEEVSGLPFATYMKNELLTPLEMNHSDFEFTPEIEKNLSAVYDINGKLAASRFFAAKAAAGLYTTVKDLSSWTAAMVQPGTSEQKNYILETKTLQEMFHPQPEARGLFSYGLGYAVEKVLFQGFNEVYHTGTNLPGWCSLVTTIPGQHDGLVLLTNSPGGAALRHKIRSAWVFWKTRSSTFGLRIQKLVNILKIIVPIGFLGFLILKDKQKS